MISVRVCLPLFVVALLHASLGHAQSEVSFDHAAACVTVLKPKAIALANRYRAGDDAAKTELVELTEVTYSIVNSAFDAGLRKDELDVLLASAKEFQGSVPISKLYALEQLCLAEGEAIRDKSSPKERKLLLADSTERVNRIRSDK